MDKTEIRQMLQHQGEEMIDLASRLSDRKGEPLERWENDLIRLAVMPRLNEGLAMMRVSFLEGRELNESDFISIKRLFEI